MGDQQRRRVLLAVLAAVFAVSAGMAVHRHIQYQASRVAALEARELVKPPPPAVTAAPPPSAGPAPEDTPPPAEPAPEEDFPPDPGAEALSGLDLGALQAVNPDVAGWIEIPGTELSYPLLQGEDNQYYLTHTWNREPNSGGSVFLECTSRRDLSGFHTIAYGHRMQDGTMFGPLKHYDDPEFWARHPSVYIATEDGVYRYDIFAAFQAHVKGMVYRLDLEGREGEFIDFCLGNSVIDTGIVPLPGDRLLTLSTCVSMGWSEYRWVVQGRLAQVYPVQ